MKSTRACVLTALLLAPLAALCANTTPIPCGDRNLPINQVYPPEAFYHNGKGGRVLDVTKPPFNAKGDGVTDDTKALCAAMRFAADSYEPLVGDGWSYCGCKLNKSWIIYLPDGEYLVSDTVSQGWPARELTHRRQRARHRTQASQRRVQPARGGRGQCAIDKCSTAEIHRFCFPFSVVKQRAMRYLLQ